ncbi:hypothetical protein KO566_08790 [Flavobacteriaceae bacterium XHP0103]|uniref:hypothetical protein n=1 Tax=Marixanthotalea marina TaxID=2844359 RepID=UPI00298A070F|nr:hypothetical protein [Marixanthotalea marina]MBU3822153.1 hypothetical protein [Marixanthotalea marina]
MKKTILFLTLLTLVFSCKNNTKNETPNQMQEVIKIHDELMPKMSTISSLINKVDSKIKETDSTEALINASKNLKEANDAMMNWMVEFSLRFDSEEVMEGKPLTDEKQKLLTEEETKIKALRDQMETSIETAEKLLK